MAYGRSRSRLAAPASGVTGSFNLNPDSGATLGATGFSGFGTAGNTSSSASDGFSSSAAIAVSTITGAGGAFTFEAMINVADTAGDQQIIAMEALTGTRPFQFRISSGNLNFINIAGAGGTVAAIDPEHWCRCLRCQRVVSRCGYPQWS